MALQLNFTVSQNCNGELFTLTEATGVYSASNPNGWGTPNAEIASIETDTQNIIITDTNGVSYNIRDTFPGLLQYFPATDTSIVFLPEHIGLNEGDVIPDGTYKFKYLLTADGDYYERTLYFFFDSQAKCCVDKMFKSITAENCCCDNTDLNLALKARGYLLAAEYAGRCGQIAKAKDLLTAVNKLCNGTGNCVNC